ncbi:TetR/AcrR family transcriptional regulator [Chitinophaga nivalis]|uniref:TetR/AcrR family transcriptional regulator n=1 Tax=Chitinophaga nivalis TaxID=2991709 RepID=A0ABT3IUY3_9BACT|nr:TetR/AcrR family transcriptional regulator [Chitinophaga nivalis]MCW3462540.1 TetR/AcrR family transcriptional regulator [Chitinophaga nivalis]MCW3487769.1 TetR/AcrR family transcriptional regulator [Chitinophaga nivalis]
MHTEAKDEMRDKILDAALKRFTHYGASKTTMNEIADDLHCSKASLYYYFADKNGMHMAVLERIAEAYFREMEKVVDQMTSAAKVLKDIIEIRRMFLSRFCRLEIFKVVYDRSSFFHEKMVMAKRREIAIHTHIIQAGVAMGEFQSEDPAATAELMVHALMGLRFTVPDQYREDMELDEAAFEQVIEKQKMLLDIFIQGMKA